jgi:hypothetical protein
MKNQTRGTVYNNNQPARRHVNWENKKKLDLFNEAKEGAKMAPRLESWRPCIRNLFESVRTRAADFKSAPQIQDLRRGIQICAAD